jgi:pimeloyl-ACP methyl ester carboxylesterase
MTDSPPARPALAYHLTEGTGPTILFLPGYASDMTGTKALALEAWAKAQGRAFLRFDYGGCGQSEGSFEEQTLTGWRDDAVSMLEHLARGPAILVGSSLGCSSRVTGPIWSPAWSASRPRPISPTGVSPLTRSWRFFLPVGLNARRPTAPNRPSTPTPSGRRARRTA